MMVTVGVKFERDQRSLSTSVILRPIVTCIKEEMTNTIKTCIRLVTMLSSFFFLSDKPESR